VAGRAGEPQPTAGGLLQAGREEEKEENDAVDVVGGVERRPEVTVEEGTEVDARDCCARRVSRARPGLDGFASPAREEEEEEEREPQWACPLWLDERGEIGEDLGMCANSPTKPGALLAGKS
jgi:hypothetical protein